MKMLVIDTSTGTLCLAVMEDGQCIVESSELVERRHSDRLLPAMEALLKEARLSMHDVERIAVGQGPGSYTGVRIGVTAAKTLAWTLGVPLVGVSSLEALAYGAVDGEATERVWIVPLTDARRKRAYTAVYEAVGSGADESSWRTIFSDRVEPIEAWLQHIKQSYMQLDAEHRPERIVFVGEVGGFVEALRSFQAELQSEEQLSEQQSEQLGGSQNESQNTLQADIVSWVERQMSAVTIGKLAWQWGVEVKQDDVHRFVPNYAQLAEAEAVILRNRS